MRFPLVLALFAIQTGSMHAGGAPLLKWWVANSLEKVRPADAEPAREARTARLYAARNEFESFQIVLRSEGVDVPDVDVEVSDLRSSHGREIARSNVTVYAERFIELPQASTGEGSAGEWPDPLVPRVDRYAGERRNAFPLKLAPARNQPVWVEVYVPQDAPPGEYSGWARVTCHGAVAASVPVHVTVWAFTLPSTASLKSSFGLSGTSILKQHRGRYTSDEELYALTHLYEKAALLHRISTYGGSMTPPKYRMDGLRVDLDWHAYDAEVGPFLNGTVIPKGEPLAGARVTSIELRTPGAFDSDGQFGAYVAAFVKHFEQKGWADRLFLYLWDEPQAGDLPKVAARGRAALSAAPDLRTLLTTSLNPAVRDVVKIWVPLVNCLAPRPGFDEYCSAPAPLSAYAPELDSGKSLWFYQSCASHGCSGHGGAYFNGWPSYMIDSSGPANRVMQWVAWKFRIQGELYYSMTEAYTKKDAWTDVRASGGNGDGTLFYPGTPNRIGGHTDIPIESIRLKTIRDGMEDYEYLKLLSAMDSEEAAAFAGRIVQEPYQWESQPEEFLKVRQELGYKLDRLTRTRASSGGDGE